MSLRLEDHVFRILENQAHLLEGLGEFNWDLDLDTGLLTFSDSDGGETLARVPVQLIASESRSTGTWLWAWANSQSEIPPDRLRGMERVREEAAREGAEVFLRDREFAIPRERFGAEMA